MCSVQSSILCGASICAPQLSYLKSRNRHKSSSWNRRNRIPSENWPLNPRNLQDTFQFNSNVSPFHAGNFVHLYTYMRILCPTISPWIHNAHSAGAVYRTCNIEVTIQQAHIHSYTHARIHKKKSINYLKKKEISNGERIFQAKVYGRGVCMVEIAEPKLWYPSAPKSPP